MKILSIFLCLSLLYSCGEGHTSAAKSRVSFGQGVESFLAGTINSGIMIYGRNKDTGTVFATKLNDEFGITPEIEIDQGNWEFAAVGWTDFNTYSTGQIYCEGFDNFPLFEPEVEIILKLDRLKCLSPRFAGNFQQNYGGSNIPNFLVATINTPVPRFKKTVVKLCDGPDFDSIKEYTDADTNSNCNSASQCISGTHNCFYRVFYPTLPPSPGDLIKDPGFVKDHIQSGAPTLSSVCTDAHNIDSIVNNYRHFRLSLSGATPAFIGTYLNSNCTGNLKVYKLNLENIGPNVRIFAGPNSGNSRDDTDPNGRLFIILKR